MSVSYDLRSESWLPIVGRDGKRQEVGLEEALLRAHEWQAISDPLPTVEFGLYRLLVAFVLDIFAPDEYPWDSRHWDALWQQGSFDPDAINGYFNKHADAFDLFSETNPFLQTAGMEADKPKPLAGLFHPLPSGTNASHFHHGHEEEFAVCPPVAARLLSTIAPWMTAGGAGLSPSINGAPPWYVLPLGRSGFETLLLNCPFNADLFRRATGDEGPAWRSPELITARRAEGASVLASLTWRPRRVQFVADERGGVCSLSGQRSSVVVRAMKFAPGLGAGFEWADPHTAYRIGDERTILRPREGREAWRDTGPLALLREKKNSEAKRVFERPAIVSQIADLRLPKYYPLDLALYGLRTDMKMKVFEWQRERLSVPLPLLWDEVGANDAQDAMENEAEKVAYQLRRAIKICYVREAKGNDKGFDALANSASTQFWRELRPDYEVLLRALASAPEARLDARQRWREAVRDAGRDALRAAIDDLDSDAAALERQTNAYKAFERALFPITEPLKFQEAKANRDADDKTAKGVASRSAKPKS